MATRRPVLTAPLRPFTGAVLCGGASRRMGHDKALLVVDGAPMALRVAAALRRAGAAEVWGVGGNAAGLGSLGLDVVADDRPGGGPFPATLTALRHAQHDIVAVLSCDLLRPSPDVIAALVGALLTAPAGTLGAVPVVAGHHQWTHAVWRREALDPLEAAFAAGARSLRRGAGDLALHEVTDIEPQLVADADRPADLPADPGTASAVDQVRPDSLPPMETPEIGVAELVDRRAAGALLIDVREDEEFAGGHVPGAHHIPLGQVVDRIDEVPRDQTVYVICARGARSATAVEHYLSQGIDAVNVAGGTTAWTDAGLPTDKPDLETGGG